MADDRTIRYNRRAHDKGLPSYRRRHPEIYNEVEQRRLAENLAEVLTRTGRPRPTVLDFGTGAGNLADRLAAARVDLHIADVSPRSVTVVGDRHAIPPSNRHVLDGAGLRDIPAGTFDLVAVYSVLHHIPDYLSAAKDLVRVLKPGGQLYLDHEAGPGYWNPDPALLEYRGRVASLLRVQSGSRLRRLTSPRWWRIKLGTWRNPRFQIDGDLHVWPDDHIEWDRLTGTLEQSGARAATIRDYLLCRGDGPLAELHRQYRDRTSDMRLGIFQKQ